MFSKVKKVKSVRNKFISGYIISIFWALVVTCILLLALFNAKIRKDMYIGEVESTRVFIELLELKLKEMNKVTSFIIEDLELRVELQEKNEIDKVKIENILNRFIVDNRDIDAIAIIDNEGEVYIKQSAPLTYKNKESFLDKIPFKDIAEKKGGTYLYIDKKYFDNESNENTVAIAREILSDYNFEPIGTVIIYVKNTTLNNIYSTFNEYIDSDYILSDKNKNTLYFTKGDSTYKTDEEIKVNKDTYSKITINGEEKSAIVDKVDLIEGKIISISNENEISDYLLIIIIVLVAMNIVFLLLNNIFIDKNILKPLDEIADGAESINTKKDLSRRFKMTASYKEIDYIVEALNSMMNRVQNLIGEVEKEQKIQNKLQLDRLNSQIKPHFLYNTLNIASSLIIIGKENDANELIYILARYYRESLSGGNEIISLGEEISLTYDYISIIKLGQRIDFTIDYDIDNTLINYEIPKLTIQPLIENSIKYARRSDDSTLNIKIKIYREEQHGGCVIIVCDNGCGMDEDVVKKIYLRNRIGKTNGFGLRSVIERISLYYDIKDISQLVEINSKKNEGTIIKILLPKDKCTRE